MLRIDRKFYLSKKTIIMKKKSIKKLEIKATTLKNLSKERQLTIAGGGPTLNPNDAGNSFETRCFVCD
jgi:hypothetical protein